MHESKQPHMKEGHKPQLVKLWKLLLVVLHWSYSWKWIKAVSRPHSTIFEFDGQLNVAFNKYLVFSFWPNCSNAVFLAATYLFIVWKSSAKFKSSFCADIFKPVCRQYFHNWELKFALIIGWIVHCAPSHATKCNPFSLHDTVNHVWIWRVWKILEWCLVFTRW